MDIGISQESARHSGLLVPALSHWEAIWRHPGRALPVRSVLDLHGIPKFHQFANVPMWQRVVLSPTICFFDKGTLHECSLSKRALQNKGGILYFNKGKWICGFRILFEHINQWRWQSIVVSLEPIFQMRLTTVSKLALAMHIQLSKQMVQYIIDCAYQVFPNNENIKQI